MNGIIQKVAEDKDITSFLGSNVLAVYTAKDQGQNYNTLDLVWSGTATFSEYYVLCLVGSNPNWLPNTGVIINIYKVTNNSSVTLVDSYSRPTNNGTIFRIDLSGTTVSGWAGDTSYLDDRMNVLGIWLKSI